MLDQNVKQNQSQDTATQVLLEDELKIDVSQAKGLWNHIRDFFALVWWSGFQDKPSG